MTKAILKTVRAGDRNHDAATQDPQNVRLGDQAPAFRRSIRARKCRVSSTLEKRRARKPSLSWANVR